MRQRQPLPLLSRMGFQGPRWERLPWSPPLRPGLPCEQRARADQSKDGKQEVGEGGKETPWCGLSADGLSEAGPW